ncbi:SMEK domain-containing protein [Aliarcobacter butzleri]|uniref:SMEK domain-containing protein n=1 Tax=Aliarcobacter butzleri TaxID=28197 RepID=UPI001EDCFF47|nr:SMEK domain-containing protein [Aliarcobacter butzleri]MCG3675281.1 SMEK domain-containing protein [Aliarcobacter butzleri]
MTDTAEQINYITDKLSFLSLKVQKNNHQGLYDINKICESVFLHLLNCSYDYNLKDANNIIYTNFPAIDLIDHDEELVIQVTSTITTQKIYNSIKKLKSLEDFSSYKLKMCYISEKPKFSKKQLNNIAEKGLITSDLISIDDIVKVATLNNEKRKAIYNLLLQRIDSKAFTLDVKGYFEKFETKLNQENTNKFSSYDNEFKSFIDSDNNILEIFAIGGNGKSHLLKHFSTLESEYTPIVFTKQDNVEADLKNLDPTQKYLFIYDDIDRFLDKSINSIFSTVINNGYKIVISYRLASKPLVKNEVLKFDELKSKELYISWNKEEIKDLILLLRPKSKDDEIESIAAQFSSNPYLITQAIKGNVDKLKNFSKKTLIDSKIALQEYQLKEVKIKELLFRIALLSPCPRILINNEEKTYVNELIKVGILRELNNKIRFNPDIVGDLYLASFVKENETRYEEIVSEYIKNHLELIITNLSYILSYESSNSLETFFKKVINDWNKNEDFKSSNLKILYRIASYIPFESFLYLKKITQYKTAKENEHPKLGFMAEFFSKINYEGDFNSSDEHINLGSIVPIIEILIREFKSEKDLGRLKIKHIIDYLVSPKVLFLPEPYYVNHTLTSVFNKMIIPFPTKNNDLSIEALEEMEKWLSESALDSKKLDLLRSAISNLFKGMIIFSDINKPIEFDTSKENVKKVLDKAKDITLSMLCSGNIDLKCSALDILNNIGNNFNQEFENSFNEEYFNRVTIELFKELEKQITQINDFIFLSKLYKILLDIVTFRKNKSEAFKLLIKIPRTDIFIFNQILIGETYIIYNLEEFIANYYKQEQENIQKWVTDNYYNKRDMDISENEKILYNNFIKTYKTLDEFVRFINSLHFIENIFIPYQFDKLLRYWYKEEPSIFNELDINKILELNNDNAANLIKQFMLENELISLDINNINESTDIEDLEKYVKISLKRKDIVVYKRLLEIFNKETKENIKWFVDNSFMNIFFQIQEDISIYNLYKLSIIELLDLVIQYRFSPSIYLIFILEKLSQSNIPFELVKNKIEKILYIPSNQEDIEEIEIDSEDNLKKIFSFLGYTLEDIFARIFCKIYFNGKFALYIKEQKNNPKECYIIKDYIKNYEDYKMFIQLVLYYYNNFTYTIGNDELQKSYKIDINYFFTGCNNEYFIKYFEELIENNNKEESIILLNAIPLELDYKEILVCTLNFLENDIFDEDIITLLKKEIYPKEVYEEFLNKDRFANKIGNTFDFIKEKVDKEVDLLVYVSENLSNINVLSEISDIINYLKDTEKIIDEISLEYRIR